MLEILIGKDVAYAAKQGGGTITGINEIDLLAAGAFAVFEVEDHTMIASGAAADSSAGKDFFFAVGVATNDPAGGVTVRRSREIPTTVPLVVKKSYAAPANKVVEIGYNGSSGSLNLPATLVVGTVATVKVYITEGQAATNPLNKGPHYQPYVKSIRSTVRVTAATTQDTLVAAIVADLNANVENDFFSAAVTGTYAGTDLNIEITGTKTFQNFSVAVDDLLAEATRTTTTDIGYGHGVPATIAELESQANIENGDDARIKYADRFFKQDSQVDTAETYATWEFQWQEAGDMVIGQDGGARQRAIIAVGDGDTIETNITTIVAALGLTVEDGDAW